MPTQYLQNFKNTETAINSVPLGPDTVNKRVELFSVDISDRRLKDLRHKRM